jgi:hypothetical protein
VSDFDALNLSPTLTQDIEYILDAGAALEPPRSQLGIDQMADDDVFYCSFRNKP